MPESVIGGFAVIVSGAVIALGRKRSVRGIVERSKGRGLYAPPEWQERLLLAVGLGISCIGLAMILVHIA